MDDAAEDPDVSQLLGGGAGGKGSIATVAKTRCGRAQGVLAGQEGAASEMARGG